MANSKHPNQPYQHSFRNVPGWHKLLLLLATLSMLSGAGLWAARGMGVGAQSRAVSAEGGAGAMGASRKSLSGTGSQPAVPEDDWAPAMFKLGGSFVIGFCMGYALRSFFKVSVVALGLVFLGMFALNHYAAEPIINWAAVSGLMERLMGKLQSELGGFKTFIEGSLPSASLAGLGLFMGFKKH